MIADKVSALANRVDDLKTTPLDDLVGCVEGIVRDLRELAKDTGAIEANFWEEGDDA